MELIVFWCNFWAAAIVSGAAGIAIGYLYRKKRLFDHKKGKHPHA